MAAGADFLKTLLVIEKFCKPFVPFLTILRNETFLQKQKMQCECVQCERPLSEMSVSGHYELRSLTPYIINERLREFLAKLCDLGFVVKLQKNTRENVSLRL